jgi:protein SCO1/2
LTSLRARGRLRPWLPAALAVLALLVTACGARRYTGSGLVLDVDRAAATVTLSHERIPGYMDAMTMPFAVRDAALLDAVRRGDRVAFRLAVGRRESRLDRLRVTSARPVEPSSWQDPVLATVVEPGGAVPEFELTDQHEARVSLGGFRGAVVAVNFIYTRCPLPDYCPRMTRHFATLERRFAAALGKDLVLLSVTLDPQHDTPEVLAAYARRSGVASGAWRFLTGDKREVMRVCGLFGIEFWPDEGAITHNLITAIVDRGGRLAASVEGKDYSAAQLGDLVAQVLERR